MTFYVISDIHSFYTPMKKALDKAGFDPNNEDHWLIVCGDAFDRGDESLQVYNFLMNLERKILVKGNHDILFKDMLNRGYFKKYDFHNGTEKTFWQIADKEASNKSIDLPRYVYEIMDEFWSQQVNYFETQHYIFVHSWIPTNIEYKGTMKPWYQEGKTLTWMENWRNANDVEWEEAMWGNPFKRWQEGLNKTGKTIVFGHWHCSTGHAMLHEIKISENESEGTISEFEDDAIWEPFIHDNIIGIDRCTAYTGEVNVLVLEDDFIEAI